MNETESCEFRTNLISRSERVVLILPGAGANVSGENSNDHRYDDFTERLLATGQSVIQASNMLSLSADSWLWQAEESNARSALEYAEQVADGRMITGFGFSAGARMLAQYAHEYSVDHLAFINPHPGLEPENFENVIEGIRQFKGTMNIAVGLDDSQEVKQFANALCHSASGDCLEYIEGADHLFSGQLDKFSDLVSLTAKPKVLS